MSTPGKDDVVPTRATSRTTNEDRNRVLDAHSNTLDRIARRKAMHQDKINEEGLWKLILAATNKDPELRDLVDKVKTFYWLKHK